MINPAGERAARVYDVKTGQLAFPELSHGAPFTSIGISDDGAVYATNAIDGQIRLWDLRTAALFAESTFKLDRRGTAALSRDGRTLLVFSATGAAHRLEVTRGPAAPLILPQSAGPAATVFAAKPPTRILRFSTTGATMLDVASGREVDGGFALPQPIRFVSRRFGEQLTVFPGEVWLAHTVAAGTTLWTWSDRGPPRETAFAETFPTAPQDVFFNRTGRIAGIYTRNPAAVTLWDLHTGSKITELKGAAD